jgi:hypothetical protein
MASEIVTDLRKPIDSDAIYDWIVEKRKTSTSDFPRLGFANEMGLIDEQRTTAADRITELEAVVDIYAREILIQRDRITQQDAVIAGLVGALAKIEAAPAWGYPDKWETTPTEVRWIAREALAKAKVSRDD